MAGEGMRFTQFYAGSHVCGPSRSVLMTGLHTGHAPVRANDPAAHLYDEDLTLAEIPDQLGYATGVFGKWGLGTAGNSGHPNRQGFDEFLGFLSQRRAHSHYPYYLWRNQLQLPLTGNRGSARGQYAHDEIVAEALDFVRRNRAQPFFLYLPVTLPHVELAVPDDSERPYRGAFPKLALADPGSGSGGTDDAYATFAGMISRLDRDVGRLLALLDELGIDDRTLVLFTSDNGAQGDQFISLVDFFRGNGPLRGAKSEFYEGGIRVPLIARWPGRIEAGTVSDHVAAFWDLLPTIAELVGAEVPKEVDGISFAPTLTGGAAQPEHDYLYWEYVHQKRYQVLNWEFTYPRGIVQAVRMGDWKAVQPGPGAPFELYDLSSDLAERYDLAKQQPEVMSRIRTLLTSARTVARSYPAPQSTAEAELSAR
jgi:arylsulfatase A-like enzyme